MADDNFPTPHMLADPAVDLVRMLVNDRYYHLATDAAVQLAESNRSDAIRAARKTLLDALHTADNPNTKAWIAVTLCLLGYADDGLRYLFSLANMPWKEGERSLAGQAFDRLSKTMTVNQLNNLALSRLHEPGVTTDGLTNLGYILGTLGCPVDRVENEQPDVRAGYLQGRVDHSRAYAGELALLWLSSGDLAVKKAAIRVLADVQPAGAMNALQHVRQEFNALKEKTPDDWDVLRRVAIAEACIYGDQKNGGQESQ